MEHKQKKTEGLESGYIFVTHYWPPVDPSISPTDSHDM